MAEWLKISVCKKRCHSFGSTVQDVRQVLVSKTQTSSGEITIKCILKDIGGTCNLMVSSCHVNPFSEEI